MIRSKISLFVVILLLAPSTFVSAQEKAAVETAGVANELRPTEREADTEKITKAIESYVAAFNARDVEKLVSHWSPQGVYLSRTSGERISGHEQLKEEFAAILKADDAPDLAVTTESIEFISPSVALERGMAMVTRGESVSETAYRVVYVKTDDRWLVDRVSEDEIVYTPSNYERLKDLEWMVGEWVDDGGDFAIELNCQWTRNQNYLSTTYRVVSEAGVESTGLQIIGWDAKQELIRSWLFDSEGGFIQGTWREHDGRWVVQSVATLADGASGSYTGVYQPLEDGTYTFTKVNRVLDGKLLPNLNEVVVRQK